MPAEVPPMKAMMITMLALTLAACQQMQSPVDYGNMTPEEIRARQICEDEVARDTRYAGSEEGMMGGCIERVLYRIRRGQR
jgi:hypothetical protein